MGLSTTHGHFFPMGTTQTIHCQCIRGTAKMHDSESTLIVKEQKKTKPVFVSHANNLGSSWLTDRCCEVRFYCRYSEPYVFVASTWHVYHDM